MPKADYTDSELWILDGLDQLAWIEIAKRKERMENSGAYKDLVRLRNELTTFFDSFTEMEIPYDNGTDDFFDVIQFKRVIDEIVTESEHIELLRQSLEQFGERAQNLSGSLSYYKGFRLADFSVETNIEMLHSWWSYISSTKGRNELGASGHFSNHGEFISVPQDAAFRSLGKEYQAESSKKMTSFPMPVRIPRRVRSKQIWSFSTDDHSIVVDGDTLRDRLVLSFDLLKPLPSVKKIELVLRSAYGFAIAKRNMSMLEKGIIPKTSLINHDTNEGDYYIRLMQLALEERKLVTEQKRVCPLIFGLYCWDLVKNGHKNIDACRHADKNLVNAAHKSYYGERRAEYGLKEILKTVDKYHPDQLPWNNSKTAIDRTLPDKNDCK